MGASYTDNFDTLVALITHLASTAYKSRTPPNIAEALSLQLDSVRNTLDQFPGFFRKSSDTTKSGEHYYTVHLRYARRKQERADGVESQPLDTDELVSLVNLVTHMVAQEQENSRLGVELAARYDNLKRKSEITLVVAGIAALASIFSAFVR